MIKTIKKIIFFLSFILLYIVFKELVDLYKFTQSIHPYLGYLTLALIIVFLIYFAFIPIYQILRIPKRYAPVKDKEKIPELLKLRIDNFRKNKFLIKSNFDFNGINYDEQSHNKIILFLGIEAQVIRKKFVSKLFYTTSISQNGFIDAILILSSSVNLIKEIFILYQGRVTNKDLFVIAKKVYYSIAIGGSEGAEYAAQEIFSKLGTESMKSIPFASKILGSLADGFVNAALLTRVSIITENYCKFIFINSDRDLYPSTQTIIATTKFIVNDLVEIIRERIIKTPKEKIDNVIKKSGSAIKYFFGKSEAEIID